LRNAPRPSCAPRTRFEPANSLTCRAVRRLGLIFLLLFLLPPLAALADEGGGIVVVDVSGPLDASALGFMADSIEEAAASGRDLVVLQVNSKAVLDRDGYDRLADLAAAPPLPLAVWVGPAPAAAYGGMADLALGAQVSAIAPGSATGRAVPAVLGEDTGAAPSDGVVEAEESGLQLQPALRQYLQDLDGATFETADGPVVVATMREVEGGVTVKQVTFMEPGLAVRFFRLAVGPEAAFLFLVVGLSLVSFEFFALGPGAASGVAAVSLLLAGWGLVNLPVRAPALAATILGWALLTAAFQKGGRIALTALGAVMLQLGGTFLVNGEGQIDPRWWLILPSVLAVLAFFLIAMPTVQRARLSTHTISRRALVGLAGVAVTDLDPDGAVEVNGARWRASTHREAGVEKGMEITVTGIDGLYLEVELPGASSPVRET